ncbi:MAG: hypothetical protein KC587_18145 [Nitrospira sp.]|nr:hypothetical protein [Nitrospira sp.]
MKPITICTILLVSVSSIASASGLVVCRGKAQIYPSGMKVDVTLPMPDPISGGQMQLWHPITLDFDAGVGLTIQAVLPTSKGNRIIATYNKSEYAGVLSFEMKTESATKTILADFKGFEGDTPLGPTELVCTAE